MLDLLEGPLQSGGFQYRRLDGTMTVQARDRAINDFTKRPEVRPFGSSTSDWILGSFLADILLCACVNSAWPTYAENALSESLAYWKNAISVFQNEAFACHVQPRP
jgi:hypothetical protein